jgi:hypothetical protein
LRTCKDSPSAFIQPKGHVPWISDDHFEAKVNGFPISWGDHYSGLGLEPYARRQLKQIDVAFRPPYCAAHVQVPQDQMACQNEFGSQILGNM